MRTLGVVVVLALLLVAVAFLLPGSYRVERTVLIDVVPQRVWVEVADFRAWALWGEWYQRDPEMAVEYSVVPSPGAVDGWSSWRSETEGNGRAQWTALKAPAMAEYELSFEGWDTTSAGRFELEALEGGTRVRWIGEGDLGNNPISRWIGLMLDRWIGKDFEAGLARLKLRCEGSRQQS